MMADEKQKLFEKQKRQHKHGCRIFRKRFGSRRALGGHMRAHGIINEAISDVDKEPTTTAGSQTCTFHSNSDHDSTNHICENCNIAFPSKKSLIEHRGCCYIVDDEGEEDDLDGLSPTSSPSSYYRGKRTRRGKKPNSSSTHPTTHHLPTEEEYLANCLVMLSTARMEPVLLIADKEESSASASKEVDEGIHTAPLTLQKPPVRPLSPPISYRMFECKTCKKLFNSHQALGGHRASHKKVKGCFATLLDVQSPDTNNALMEDENNNFDHENNQIGSSSENIPLAIIPLAERPSHPLPNKKLKVHACPNCKREFNSGQALGGHMRCHWKKENSAATSAASVEPINVNALNLQFECRSNEANIMQPRTQTLLQKFNSSDHQSIDLNLPAPMDDLVDISLRLDLTVAIYLQPGGDVGKKTESATNLNDIEAKKESNQNLGEEAESKEVKLAKLWDLMDMNADEERSTLLQIGTGSMADQQSSDDTS